jgi:hypothetical protein
MASVIVITCVSRCPRTHREEVVVSHGICSETLKGVVLPPERWTPGMWGTHYDQGLGEWVIPDEPQNRRQEGVRMLSYG